MEKLNIKKKTITYNFIEVLGREIKIPDKESKYVTVDMGGDYRFHKQLPIYNGRCWISDDGWIVGCLDYYCSFDEMSSRYCIWEIE